MKIMLARLVATVKIQRPLQKRLLRDEDMR